MMKLFIGLAALACGAPALAGDGPFGLEQGMTYQQAAALGKLEQKGSHTWRLNTPPKPHPAFEGYGLLITPGAGLCKVSAMGKNVDSNSYGIQIRSEFNRMVEALTKKYGNPKVHDDVLPGSLWEEEKYFMMALSKKERRLLATWFDHSLPNNIESISVEARGLDSQTAYIKVTYDFNNIAACVAEVKQQTDAGL